jgi:tRNA-Thr(GGU) m(6)t(6)A37 methyltransferase TsaA
MVIEQIGVIHSPFHCASGTPVQPRYAGGNEGTVEVFEAFGEGLRDLEGFERIWLLFWCHRAAEAQLTVVPYRDERSHGLFATRAPARPNPIGMSAVRLHSVKGRFLQVSEIDILDGTPLLDIKPYVAEYDSYPAVASGWLRTSSSAETTCVADGRFEFGGGIPENDSRPLRADSFNPKP